MWRSSDWVERAIFISLALMLLYNAFVVIRFARCYYSTRRECKGFEPDDLSNLRRINSKLLSDLSPGIGMLRGIALTAPFLGLAGTCYGVSASLFVGFGLQKSIAEAILMRNSAGTLVTTAAGILVAIPATFSYNLLQNRIAVVSKQLLPKTPLSCTRSRSFRLAQTLPLRRRFSSLPHFSAVAAAAVACVLALFMAFEPYVEPTGLSVSLPATSCYLDSRQPSLDRRILLRIVNGGHFFINMEPEDSKNLRPLLAEMYRHRENRDLLVFAEDEVPFQTVADTIEIVRNSPGPGADSLDIRVILVTPQSSRDCVLMPVRIVPMKPVYK